MPVNANTATPGENNDNCRGAGSTGSTGSAVSHVIPILVSYVNNALEQTGGRRAERIIEEVRQTTATIHVGSALEFDHTDMLFIRFRSPANRSPAMR